mgnify:CR=1 FL=1
MKVINPKYITVKGSEATLLLTFVKIRIFGPFSEKEGSLGGNSCFRERHNNQHRIYPYIGLISVRK